MRTWFWLSYAFRSLARSGRRAVFAVLCVTVGVAGVVSLQIASLTVQNALTSNVRASNGGDVSLSSQEAPLSSRDLSVFRSLKRQGLISEWTAVSSERATTVGSSHRLVPFEVLLVQTPPYPLGGDPTFVTPSNGHVANLIRHSGDVYITSVLAQELGVSANARLLVNGIGGRGLHALVRGVVSESSFEHSAAMTVSRHDARALTSRSGHYTAIYANVNGDPNVVADRLRAVFPAATVQTVKEALQAARANVHDFQQFMLLVGLLALLIAGIGILNAMQSMLTRRRLEIAMLKALGFRRPTLYALFAAEAVMIGLLGGIVGTALGAALSKVITDALARAQALQVTFVLDRGTLLGGIGLGIGAALAFGVLPIARAAAFRPLEMLREGTSVSVRGWTQTIALLALVVSLFAVLAAVTLSDTILAFEFVLGAATAALFLTGAFSLLVTILGRLGPVKTRGVAVAALFALVLLAVVAFQRQPALAAILSLATIIWAANLLLPARMLLPLLIASRSMSRRKARTSVTLVAFLVGVLAMTITLTVAMSLQGQINAALVSNGGTNLVAITNPSGRHGILRSSLRLAGVKSRTETTVVQTNPQAVNGQPLVNVIGQPTGTAQSQEDDRSRLLGGVTGWDLHQGWRVSGVRIVAGRRLSRQDAGGSNALVRHDLQFSPYRLKLGDTVRVRESGTGNERNLRVVGFYERPRRGRAFGSFFTPPIYTDRSIALSLGGPDAQAVFSFSVDPKNLAHDATSLQTAAPGALIVNVGDLTAAVETILNELLNLLVVITALVLGAGVAVVANGVALAMLEQRRELALYKAIGFGPGSVLRFVLVENALMGTLAGAVSVLCTAVGLALLSHFALAQAIGFDPVLALVVLIIAATLAVATSYLIARGPLRIRPVEVLRNE